MTPIQVLRLKRLSNQAAEHHKGTAFHEFPQTCGGCHFWQGYQAAVADVLSGQMPKFLAVGASTPEGTE